MTFQGRTGTSPLLFLTVDYNYSHNADELLHLWIHDRARGDDAFFRLAKDINHAVLPEDKPKKLTPAQRRMIIAASMGLTVPMMADVYGLSYSTCRHHVVGATKRMSAKNLTHAVALAIRSDEIH